MGQNLKKTRKINEARYRHVPTPNQVQESQKIILNIH